MGFTMSNAAYAPEQARPGAVSATLTTREVEVLRLMADGLSTREIAARLDVSFKTAACHRYRVLQKLCVESTVSAVRWAIRQGLVEP
jgi:DNA-binding NarL/FixJ family response regulator